MLSMLLVLVAHAQDPQPVTPTEAEAVTEQTATVPAPVFRVALSGAHVYNWSAAEVSPELRANIGRSLGVISRVSMGASYAALSPSIRRQVGADIPGVGARGGNALLGVGPRWGRAVESMAYVGVTAETWALTGATYRGLVDSELRVGPAQYGYGPAAGLLTVVPLSRRFALRGDTSVTWLERRLRRRASPARAKVPPVSPVDADAFASDRLTVNVGLEAQVAVGEALSLTGGLTVHATRHWGQDGVGSSVQGWPRVAARWAL
ncbi:MAG: hypothetical protein ACI9K2_006459 [Myxococcota bacterium]|jgi:hypothetical protein